MPEMISVGKSELRKDALEKVTGQAKYTADIPVEQLKHGVVLRSSHQHALIHKIDTQEALKIPGILAIITAEDIPGDRMYGEIIVDRPALASEKVRFTGEPIAVIVAETRNIAEKARDKIQVVFEPLPAAHDPEEALKPSAAPIHPDGNLQGQINIHEGDIEAGFREADVILEEVFSVPRIYPAYMETEASLACWNLDESLTVWVSSQKPFQDQDTIRKILGLPTEKVVVKEAVIGGAFGGKEDSNLAVLAALAAWKIRGSVRLVNTREESILAHPKRHPARLYYRIGAKKDGSLTALQATVYMDTGAYASYGPAVGQLLTETVTGPYRIPNVKVDTFVVYTNNPISGAMRGFGSPQTSFAYESLMDMLALKLGLPAAELRRRNIWRSGAHSFTRVKVNQPEGLEKMLEIAVQECERLKAIPPQPGKHSGVGFALAMQTMGLGYRVPDDSSNRLEWLPDGRVLLYLGAPDLGQGLMTVAAQMTAEALGIPYSQIEVLPVDTAITPDGGVTCASRMTYSVGNSVILASQQMIDSLVQETARFLQTSPEKLEYRNGLLYRVGHENEKAIPAREIISRMAEEDRKLEAMGTFSFPYGPETPDHLPFGMPHVLFCFGAQVARVEVDPQLGTVDVTEMVAIHDLGKVINRHGVEGQIEGGIATGMGYALSEEVKLKNNDRWVDGFSEYLMATSLDVPHIRTHLLELPEASGPFGVKGIGEIALVPTAPAITNAIFDATGVRIKSIPVKSEDLI